MLVGVAFTFYFLAGVPDVGAIFCAHFAGLTCGFNVRLSIVVK